MPRTPLHGSVPRLGAWLTLAVFLAGWLAPQWHHAEAVHAWCAEHGAFEHAEEALPEIDVSVSRLAAAHDDDSEHRHAEELPVSGDLDAHGESCQLSMLGRIRAVEVPSAVSFVPVLVPGPAHVRAAEAGVRSVALLRQAPKTSPPGLG